MDRRPRPFRRSLPTLSRSDKFPPDPGLPREQKDSLRWLGDLTKRLYSLLRQMIESMNLLTDGYLLNVAALPTISNTHRGRLILLRGGAGVVDKIFLARKKADETFEWIEVVP